ncbi:MAG: trypsin-like peptidase domain-containing protein [Lachnospiraceae bacterium]|nr:trypsin-like peptidase domain-containing protein [Lachnospiraceae bacterium]
MKKRKSKIGKKVVVTVLCGLLCGGLLGGAPIGYSYYKQYKTQREMEAAEKQEANQLGQTGGNGAYVQQTVADRDREASVYDVSTVWDNVIPAMVEIDTKYVTAYRFFGHTYEEESEGRGTGIIIAQGDELFLVTNHHVVDGATAIQIKFVDGSTAPAELKGADAEADIAVLSVDFSDLQEETLKQIRVATIGDSGELASGEMVIAIGNAAGHGQSLTVGYVSALDREVTIEGVTMNLIQTDAAINPGNSGGALLNAKGELVGINNAKLVASDVEGVGYSIPVSKVVSLINQLMNREEIRYKDSAMLGIIVQDVTENLSATLNIPRGVYIVEVEEDSAAAKAGIPLYGVITEVNGISVKSQEQLNEVLSYIRGGTTGTVTVQERVEGEYTPKEYTVTFDKRGGRR